MPKRNLAPRQQMLRVVLAGAFVALVYQGGAPALGWLALYPLATGLTGFSPLKALAGRLRERGSHTGSLSRRHVSHE